MIIFKRKQTIFIFDILELIKVHALEQKKKQLLKFSSFDIRLILFYRHFH
jgi:hypothetical protein